MVSQTTLTILFAYAAAFWCLDALSEAGKTQTSRSATASIPRLAAAALLPAVLATFGLTSLLLFAHVRALGGANAAAGAAAAAAAARRRHFLDRLANATLAATAAALLAGAALRLGAHGYLGGADDIGIGWL
ncbi:hypothetical protein BDA96_10G091300 [Sorghum bicolor]|uniref:Uncharacterized protein n=1 Tax=Sorghum bicolor TaxID=4558 RepID=A0A921Q0C0_SORBI|nr:hypothetical protein BDA96_10G091300 [Sorghum bicolor]